MSKRMTAKEIIKKYDSVKDILDPTVLGPTVLSHDEVDFIFQFIRDLMKWYPDEN